MQHKEIPCPVVRLIGHMAEIWDVFDVYLDFSVMENIVTKIAICIEHKNLPLAASNILVEQMTPEEIKNAVASFEDVLSQFSDDSTMIISKPASVIDRETIYIISSSLEERALIFEIERALSSLKLGGHILESVNEIKVGTSDDCFIAQKI